MLRRNYIIAFVIVSIAFLASCSAGRGTPRGTEPIEYRVGTQGLELQFTQNSPPYRIYAEDETFPVSVEVRNRGVYPGENEGSLVADLYFRGFDATIISGLDVESMIFEEEDAKTRFNPEGGLNIVQVDAFVDSAYFDINKVDVYDADIVATVCYPYRTHATIDVCIDPNPNKDSSQDTCTPGAYNVGSQGAPVAITDVESISQKGKARFIITISNVGGGDVLREGALGYCIDQDIDVQDEDKVELLNAELANGLPLDCTPYNEITLHSTGSAIITCKADGLDESLPALKTILTIELGYGYRKSIRKTVNILGE